MYDKYCVDVSRSGSVPCAATTHQSIDQSSQRSPRLNFAVLVFLCALIAILPACSGGGGDNGTPSDALPQPTAGPVFSYPVNEQQDVVLDSQIVVKFADSLPAAVANGIQLQSDGDTVSADIEQDSDQSDIVRITPTMKLAPSTQYQVVATKDGDGSFNAGDALFSFTTRPAKGRPVDGDLAVVETTPGNSPQAVFTSFNALRVRFSEPVDPATVIQGDSFSFTNTDGDEIDGRLTVLGRNLTFDPSEDLAAGDYSLQLTDAVTSVFGKSLSAYTETKTVVSAGNTATQNLRVTPVNDRPDSILNGTTTNLANISSQLIASNDQLASAAQARGGVKTTLAEPGLPAFNGTIPAVIRAGQIVELTGLNLRLNGEIQTPILSGPIQTTFINDADVYLMGNDYRDFKAPTAVRLRFDLGIGTLIKAAAGTQENVVQSLANGVFNQTALNIQAAGLAIPQKNGDLQINAVGTFPINVNRDGDATVQLALSLLLPGGDQPAVQPDTIPPFVTAASPSACLYVFGSPAYDVIYADQGVAPTVLPEALCSQAGAIANNYPIESSPAVVFSEPLDPATVNGQSITLTNRASGDVVDATYQVEGTTVVINPVAPLSQNQRYDITINEQSMLTDLAGNAATEDNVGVPLPISFVTEPLSDNNPTAPLLGALSPGVPCALDGGDFNTGGDMAGQCVGDADNGTTSDYPVFQSPVDVPVEGAFSKLVQTSSIVAADGCLTSGSGDANTVTDATVALQQMDGDGQCVDAVPGEIAFANPGDDMTRAFTFRPEDNLTVGTRYWVVVCGDASVANGCTSTIVDGDGVDLNTNPIAGTGSTSASAAGGPDIISPFDAIAANKDYYTAAFTLPAADSNGNGEFDDGENPQPGNRSLLALTLSSLPVVNPDSTRPNGKFASYLSLARPIALRGTLTGNDCSTALGAVSFDDDSSAVGENLPDHCIQASLLPGGINSLTSVNLGLDAIGGTLDGLLSNLDETTGLDQVPILGGLLDDNGLLGGILGTVGDVLGATTEELGEALGINGLLKTGRILLRFPNAADGQGLGGQRTQSGFIIEKCTGTFPAPKNASGDVVGEPTPYDFEPCFAASLSLVANAPDGQGIKLKPVQQRVTANVVGPVAFLQNGRLDIAVRNTNTITLDAQALGLLPATAIIGPTELNFQLVGNATHGGRAFPNR